VTVESGLATFQDEEEKIVTYPFSNLPFPIVNNPYPDQTPVQMLSRWYQINTKQYTTTSAASITQFLSEGLFQVANVQRSLSTFAYFRFKAIEFRVQYSSVPMVYGWLTGTCLPFNTQFSSNGDMLASHTDTVLLDLSCQQDVTFSSPWISPEQWLDVMRYYTGSTLTEVNQTHLLSVGNIVNPVHVLDSGATNTVTLQIFARFVEPEVAGHVEMSLSPPSPFTAQMDKVKAFDFLKIPSMFGQGTMSMPMRGLNPNDEFGGQIMESLRSTEVAGAPKSAPSPSQDPDEPELKPNLYGSLVCTSPKYVLGSGNQSTGSRDYSVLDILRIPTRLQAGTIDSSFTFTCGVQDRYSRISYFSQLYRMWRGSIEYTLVLFSSPFVTARYNLVLNFPTDQTPLLGILGNKIIQDITVRGTTRVSFTVPYLYPTQWMLTPWQGISGNDPFISIEIISAPESVGDITPEILYVLYECAAPDFQFRSLVNPMPLPETFTAQMRTSEFVVSRDLFSGNSKPLGFSDDSEMSISSLLSRWSYSVPSDYRNPPGMRAVTSGVFQNVCQVFAFYSGQIKHKLWIDPGANPYVPVVMKMESFIGTGAIGPALQERFEDGIVYVSNEITQVLECTVPFLAMSQYWPTKDDTVATFALGRFMWRPELFNATVSVTPEVSLVSAGPDFSLYFPVPPPPTTFWASTQVSAFKKPRNFGTPTVSLSDEKSLEGDL